MLQAAVRKKSRLFFSLKEITMKLKLFILLFLAFAFHAFAQKFTIAAAADLRSALSEVVNTYKATDSTVKIDVIFGASGNLFQQISNQAPFDIFFSADNSYPQKLEGLKLTATKPKLYAIGHLVLWSASKDVSKGIELLKSPDVKKIAIANPEVAPYGKRAMECLKYYKIDELVKDKLVKGENISQAAQFALSGNAEVGLIALSLALSPEMTGKGKYITIDEKSYNALEQSYVVLKRAEQDKNVAAFINFLQTEKARKIFIKFGFKLPSEK